MGSAFEAAANKGKSSTRRTVINCKRNIWNAMDDSWEIDPGGKS